MDFFSAFSCKHLKCKVREKKKKEEEWEAMCMIEANVL